MDGHVVIPPTSSTRAAVACGTIMDDLGQTRTTSAPVPYRELTNAAALRTYWWG